MELPGDTVRRLLVVFMGLVGMLLFAIVMCGTPPRFVLLFGVLLRRGRVASDADGIPETRAMMVEAEGVGFVRGACRCIGADCERVNAVDTFGAGTVIGVDICVCGRDGAGIL